MGIIIFNFFKQHWVINQTRSNITGIFSTLAGSVCRVITIRTGNPLLALTFSAILNITRRSKSSIFRCCTITDVFLTTGYPVIAGFIFISISCTRGNTVCKRWLEEGVFIIFKRRACGTRICAWTTIWGTPVTGISRGK